MSKESFGESLRAQTMVLGAIALLVGVGLAMFAGNWSETRVRQILDTHSQEVLALQKGAIFGLLDKYRLMTVLIAQRPDISHMFTDDLQQSDKLNSFAGRLTAMSGASNVWFALPDGSLIAQSSLLPAKDNSLDESLVTAPRQERLGRATLFGQNGVNSYAFSASVRQDNRVVGIIAVEVDLQVLANAWALSQDLIFVTNANGQLIVSNQLAGNLAASDIHSFSLPARIVDARLSDVNQPFLARGETFPLINWTLNVLTDYRPALRARSIAIIMTLLITVLFAALSFILLQRRDVTLARLRAEQLAAEQLEKRVEERTHALSSTNAKLRIEYDERLAAETALKKAQEELVRSAKLAAIGQMSAALAHEYNQPLAAIRSYADSAGTLLKQAKPQAAEEYIHHITRMTERMAELSRTLKTFAREPRSHLGKVLIEPLLEEAIVLVGPTAKNAGVSIHFERNREQSDGGELEVLAGHVRLSQVVVNLLTNAIDAMKKSQVREVFLKAFRHEDQVCILVEDTGPGVPEDQRHSIFDAFVTSKDVGAGLGLGLSIAYNIVHDFGGKISVDSSSKGGAAFKILLPAHSASEGSPPASSTRQDQNI